MAKKVANKRTTQKQKKFITPLRVSIALNILLGALLIVILGGFAYAYHEYKTGSELAIKTALNGNLYYCEQAEKRFDEWVARNEEPLSEEAALRVKLATNLWCQTEDAQPFLNEAYTKYMKANGINYNADGNN